MTEKTQKQAATNNETRKHISNVGMYIGVIINLLYKRALAHDSSKLESPEVEGFTAHTAKLAATTYGSDEYHKSLQEDLKPALIHHYAKNRHHPEHYPNGIEDMTLVDILEMICDWKAATLRHHDGNILKSIDHNTERFNIDPQLAKILKNTVDMFEHVDGVLT